MTFDEIFAEWEKDAKFDETDLGEEATRIPGLLSKYWKMYKNERKLLRKMEIVLKKLRLDKVEFYTMGAHEGTPKEWRLPAQGRVPKNEVDKYLDVDINMVAEALKVADQRDVVEFLEAIINSIKGRGWELDKKIKWVMWTNGAT